MTIAFDLHHQNDRLSSFFEDQLNNFLVKLATANPGLSFIIYGGKPVDGHSLRNYLVQPALMAQRNWLQNLFSKSAPAPALRFRIFTPELTVTSTDVLLIADLSPLVHPQHFAAREIAYFKKKLLKGIANAKALVVFSPYYRQLLLTDIKVPEPKLHLWNLPLPANVSEMAWEEKEAVKEQFTTGIEYFLFAGDLHPRHELLTLLKAFSDFKKWQRSGMKLVLALNDNSGAQELTTLLTNYKYRNDVILVKDPPGNTLQQLVAAAYCMVYPALYDPSPQIIRYAMASRVPVITSDIPEIRTIGGDGLIYAAVSVAELSPFMQRVYKDEAWRAEMLSKAFTAYVDQEQRFEEILRKLLPAAGGDSLSPALTLHH